MMLEFIENHCFKHLDKQFLHLTFESNSAFSGDFNNFFWINLLKVMLRKSFEISSDYKFFTNNNTQLSSSIKNNSKKPSGKKSPLILDSIFIYLLIFYHGKYAKYN